MDFTDGKSTLVDAWWHQAITWANVDPDFSLHMTSLGHNELTHADWVMYKCVSEQSQWYSGLSPDWHHVIT